MGPLKIGMKCAFLITPNLAICQFGLSFVQFDTKPRKQIASAVTQNRPIVVTSKPANRK